MNIGLISLLGKAQMPSLKKLKFLEQPRKKELNAFNVATIWSNVYPENPSHSVLFISPSEGCNKNRNILYHCRVTGRQSGTTMLVPGVEQNPGVGLCIWNYSSMKCKMLMTLPYSDLRDPTPWLPSLSFGPQRFAGLKENVDNIPASKNRNRSSRGLGFLLHPERHAMFCASAGGSDGKGNFEGLNH